MFYQISLSIEHRYCFAKWGSNLSANTSSFENILKQIQKSISFVPVIVLGSGASAAYGYAGMPELANYLLETIIPEPPDEAKWKEFASAIEGGMDLENALQKVMISGPLEKDIIRKTRDLILRQDIDIFHRIITNQIILPLGSLLQFLSRTANQKISVVTTNYDRLVEYAIDQALLSYENGFYGEYQKTFRGLHTSVDEKIELLKVHGSLDWFLTEDNRVISLPDSISSSLELTPLIVTPGIRKYEHAYNEPFRSIISKADAAFESAKSILCIGYGFNDNHIHLKLNNKMRQGRTPILIATKKLTDNAIQFIQRAPSSNVFGIEEFNKGTRVVFSDHEVILEDYSFWSLDELIKLVM